MIRVSFFKKRLCTMYAKQKRLPCGNLLMYEKTLNGFSQRSM